MLQTKNFHLNLIIFYYRLIIFEWNCKNKRKFCFLSEYIYIWTEKFLMLYFECNYSLYQTKIVTKSSTVSEQNKCLNWILSLNWCSSYFAFALYRLKFTTHINYHFCSNLLKFLANLTTTFFCQVKQTF